MLLSYLKLSFIPKGLVLHPGWVLPIVFKTQQDDFVFGPMGMIVKACLLANNCPVYGPFFRIRVQAWILADVVDYLFCSGYKIFDFFFSPFFFYSNHHPVEGRPFNRHHDFRSRALISAITSSCCRVSLRLDSSRPFKIDALESSLKLSKKSWSEKPSSNLTSSSIASSSVVIIFSTILNFVVASIKTSFTKFNSFGSEFKSRSGFGSCLPQLVPFYSERRERTPLTRYGMSEHIQNYLDVKTLKASKVSRRLTATEFH
jgi:hypothetical protein